MEENKDYEIVKQTDKEIIIIYKSVAAIQEANRLWDEFFDFKKYFPQPSQTSSSPPQK